MPNAPSNAASNTNIATGQSPSAAETKQIVLKVIGAKWSKFSEQELSSLKDKDDLVSQVVAKYGLEKSQAQRDVDALMERPPDLTQGPIEVEVASLRPRSAGDVVGARFQPMVAFDYGVPAEVFPARNRKYRRQAIGYRRFARAADAIRFAIEELPPELLLGTFLEVDGERHGSAEIRRLYESSDYLLPRRAAV
jgi:hypothetical protein